MRPVLVELPLPWGGHLALPAYGTMLLAGFLIALLFARQRRAALGLSGTEVFDCGYIAVIAGVIGAHLGHVLLHPEVYFDESLGAGLWRALVFWRGGLAYYGGLAGGIAALTIWARFKGVPTLDLLDFVAPVGAVALAATRIGCFLNGCCYGKPTAVAWAVSYPAGSRVQRAQLGEGLVSAGEPSLPIHPAQLYELLAALSIFAPLWWLYPRRRFSGQITLIFFLLYAPWRFFVEFLRADSPPWRPSLGSLVLSFGPLTAYQVLSLLLFLAAALLLWAGARRQREARVSGENGDRFRSR